MAKTFEELTVWQEARLLVKDIYTDFGPETPGHNDFGFKGQIQTAGVSIMNNIAEGFERKTKADFAHFLDIAKGSCGEVRSMYYTAEDLNYVSPSVASDRRQRATRISQGIANLARSLRCRDIEPVTCNL